MLAFANPHTLIAAALGRALAPRKPLTVSQWSDLHRRLSSKGSAEPGRWRTDRNPPLREPMDCLSSRSAVREEVLMFPIQFGKALSLDTPLPTPTGWTTMGDVAPGAGLFGDDGRPVRVVAVSEVFHDHPCYRLTFSDGAEIVADAGHRWQVVDLQARAEARKEIARRAKHGGPLRTRNPLSGETADHTVIKTTAELCGAHLVRGTQSRYAVQVAAPLELPAVDLPIDPYLLGVWLGDGAAATGGLSLNEQDAPYILGRIRAAGYVVAAEKTKWDAKRGSACITARVNPRGCGLETLHALVRAAGLQNKKHIPAAYLRASRAQREALLQGLMDTDGHAAVNGVAEITSSYPALADGIVELLRTLGHKPVLRWRKTARKDSARITCAAFAGSSLFSLPRKAANLPAAPSARQRNAAPALHHQDRGRALGADPLPGGG